MNYTFRSWCMNECICELYVYYIHFNVRNPVEDYQIMLMAFMAVLS